MKIPPAIQDVAIQGFELPVFAKPVFADKLTIPADITQLDSQDVSRLMGRFTAVQAWVGQQLADLEFKIARAANALDAVKASLYSEQPHLLTRLNKNQKEDTLSTYPEVQKLEFMIRSLHAARRQHELMSSSLERVVMVLSRELSRKTASRDGMNFEKVRRV